MRVGKWGNLCQEGERRRGKEREVVQSLHPSKKPPHMEINHSVYSESGEKRGVESLGRKLSIIMGFFCRQLGKAGYTRFCTEAVSRSVLSKGWCIKRKQMGSIPSVESLWTET